MGRIGKDARGAQHRCQGLEGPLPSPLPSRLGGGNTGRTRSPGGPGS